MSSNLPIKLGRAATLVVAAIFAIMTLYWPREPFGPAEVIQSRGPLNLAEAKLLSGLPYPDSAKNIRFARFSQWVAYETFVRFEAPEADCIAFAERIMVAYDREHARSAPVKLGTFEGPIDRSIASSSHLDTHWFDVQAIRHGIVGGSGPSHSPKVWIDTARGVCYYKQTD